MKHRLGEQQEKDVCLLQEDNEDCFLALAMTDGAYVTINSSSKTASEVHLLSCANPDQPLKLVQPRTANLEYFVSHSQGQLYILTNANGAANYQLMTAPLHTPCSAHWRPLVPEQLGTAVEDLEVYASHAVLYERQQGRPAVSVLNLLAQASKAAESQQHAAGVFQDSPAALTSKQQQTAHVAVEECNAVPTSQCQQHELEQKKQHQQQQQAGATTAERPQAAQQPQLTTLSFPSWALSIQPGANPDHHTRTVRLHVASPVHPQHVYDYHLDTGQLQLLGAEQLHGHDPEQYVCQVQYVKAADGTQVPLTVLHKKGMPLNGSHPALLTVYGAYGISLETGFEPERLVLLDRGWVIALAHVRGGGELGRRWHAAGRSLHKMNSLTDLEACLDHLLQQGYSRKGLVGVQAASAGGLLVGALLNRRPHDLLAAILRVPFVDFLTSMTQPELPLTVHEYGEWGDPADPAVLQQMRELCPYQNIKTAEYPPVLATCSATDPRVPVWGPAKWVAKSRQHQIGPSPILLLSSSDTGHYAHEADLLENSALEYAFLIDAFQKKHHINAK
ncbi:TPA: hypothetical protein ACH3X3_005734 [Trebouxia sp. C0006]